jgi:Family of unknown function (DUF6455)
MPVFQGRDYTLRGMAEMMWRLGLTALPAAQARTLDIRAAIGTCLTCPAGEHCRDWLKHAPETLDEAPAFCPNAVAFMRTRQA